MQNNDKLYKVDFHTHSSLSYDGGLTKKQYKKILESEILNCIAITDHNETAFARELHDELGDKIIVGEEIRTSQGEIIGLFLTKTISPGLSALETVTEIHKDGGLVYIPHPFETGRDSLQQGTLQEIIEYIDIVEVFNARGFLRGKPEKALEFAISQERSMAASSDAHCKRGIGSSYTVVSQLPGKNSLVRLLENGLLQKKLAPFYSLLCPGINKIRNKIFLVK